MSSHLALYLTVFGALLLVAVLLDAMADRLRMPGILLVLFFGGLTTSWATMRPVLRPAFRLASVGSLLTALLLMAVVLGLGALPVGNLSPSLPVALFVGAMLCSTDASAVMALLALSLAISPGASPI